MWLHDLAVFGVKLLIPSYTKGKHQLSQNAVGESRLVWLWVHVEQVIRKLGKEVHHPTCTSYTYTVLKISLIKFPSDCDKTID